MARELSEMLEAALAEQGVLGRVVPANLRHLVADAPPKFVLQDSAGRNIGFLLCSSPTAPDLIARGVERANAARDALGEDLGQAVLVPANAGSLDGLTWALLPYHKPISSNRVARYLEKRSLTPALFAWLRESARRTVTPGDPEAIRAALHRICTEPFAREAASEALKQLDDGRWQPRFVLAHNDFWLGNVLHASGNAQHPFVIIDWLGSCARGFAMFDLIRLAESIGLSRSSLSREIDVHCTILSCTREQSGFYLLCALGHVAMNLEHFPKERFERMARSCWDTWKSGTT